MGIKRPHKDFLKNHMDRTKSTLLIATGIYPPDIGGPATYSKLLKDELSKKGIDVKILSFGKVRHLPVGLRHTVYFFRCISSGKKCKYIYAQDTVSVGLPALIAAKIIGKKFLLRVPGDYAWEQGRQRFGITDSIDEFQNKRYSFRVEILRKVQKFVVHHANVVIVPSHYMEGIVLGWGVKPIVIHSSIKLPVNFILPSVRPEGFLIVSAGRRVPWKCFEALESVVKKEKDWNIFIAEKLSREETLGWIKTADVFILNSTYEGLSHLLVEAMSLGTPIIATSVGGNQELIENGVSGLLVPPQNNEILYKAIKSVEENPLDAQIRVGRARERAKDFSVDKAVNDLFAILKTL